MGPLYATNPYVNQMALGMFSSSRCNCITDKPFDSSSLPLRGTRSDIRVTAGVQPAFGGLRGVGLGDWASDLLTSVGGSVSNIVDSVTGRGAARDQATAAARVAELQAQARIAEAQASSNLWGQTLPIVGIAGAAAAALIVVVLLRK